MPYLINSLAITIPATIMPVTLAAMAAYALARTRFKGSDVLFFIIFALQVVPLQMALIPLLRLFSGGFHIGSVTIIPAWGWAAPTSRSGSPNDVRAAANRVPVAQLHRAAP